MPAQLERARADPSAAREARSNGCLLHSLRRWGVVPGCPGTIALDAFPFFYQQLQEKIKVVRAVHSDTQTGFGGFGRRFQQSPGLLGQTQGTMHGDLTRPELSFL